MKNICKVILLCFVTLTVIACNKPEREIKAGRYGMMSDETPQYAALVFIMVIYEDDNLNSCPVYTSVAAYDLLCVDLDSHLIIT